ncbi:MAG: hypothetical protein WCB77_27060 [Pseudolabrys sp.]
MTAPPNSAAKAAAISGSEKHERSRIRPVPSTSVTWLNVTRTVPFVHVIQPFAEAAERHPPMSA